MPIAWKPSLSLGVPVVDRQHEEIVSRASALVDALQAERGDRELAHLFQLLGASARAHFATEEALLRRRADPGLSAHAFHHLRFRRRLVQLRRRLGEDGPTPALAFDVNRLVRVWFFDHVATVDAAAAPLLGERPEEEPPARAVGA